MQSESSTVRPTKKQRFSRLRKACVVCHARGDWGSEECVPADEYWFYIVDVDSSSAGHEYTQISPTIRLTGFTSTMTFCALKNTIYMFEGVEDHRYAYPGARRLAVKLMITPEILAGSDYVFTKRDLTLAHPRHNLFEIRHMNHPKISPVALPTPNGNNIIVFSSMIYCDSSADTAFELYHVHYDMWEQLPTLPRKRVSVSIASYGFVGESHFLVQFGSGLFFVLDFHARVKNWEQVYYFAGPQRILSTSIYFLGIGDGDFCFTPGFGYDIRDRDSARGFFRPHSFQLSSLTPKTSPDRYFEFLTFSPDITLLGVEAGVYDSCVLQAEMMTTDGLWGGLLQAEMMTTDRLSGGYIRLILDVHSTDIEKYKRDKEANSAAILEPTHLKSFNFLIDADGFFYPSTFYLLSIEA